jgi:type I restriction enzyme R subunit
MVQSQNFEFLREKFPLLADLGAVAEAVIYTDPGSSTTRLRSFAEEVVKSIYEFESLPRTAKANFADLLLRQIFKIVLHHRLCINWITCASKSYNSAWCFG